jgi:hypothetical protein
MDGHTVCIEGFDACLGPVPFPGCVILYIKSVLGTMTPLQKCTGLGPVSLPGSPGYRIPSLHRRLMS